MNQHSSNSPFTTSELLPQEEMLEIKRSKGQLFIGLPKETSYQEKRVCLTPDAVNALTANGHRVLIESGAGNQANFSDRDYSEAGGEIIKSTQKVFACPIVLKVAPPSEDELELMKPKSILISTLQLKTRKKSYCETLANKRITALAFEFIKDQFGGYPAVRALSEIAGTSSILIAAEYLSNMSGGNGLMFGNISGVPPIEVVILGAGTVGEFAARSALGLGAGIKVFDSSLTKLRCLQNNVGRSLFTSTLQPKILLKALKRADVVIGAVRGQNRAPVVVTEEMVKKMKKGAVIIDVSIDMGGCIETSSMTTHDQPTMEKHGVIHYCVPNIPSRYSRTASLSISNIFTPYLLDIGEEGGLEHALRTDAGLRNGLYFYHGILTNKSVADWFDLNHRDPNLLIF
ncbi:alanine dehydrogenase Ald [Psychroflexus torquis ATCC 700755]|uniref:alanine dehydrogenase n=1 Tax=Psychroflexus torquis (strain ATCC 700755 / CIP 106069 / ACAM 623) TaxID=313595 RepID=K4IJD1_PSYTT|nr:alanine dehydrogenase [Psychroflexus torquis]AFU70454.1 alanine dehydrogenase Ald [Psychroflexus torquis ATCC 700755]